MSVKVVQVGVIQGRLKMKGSGTWLKILVSGVSTNTRRMEDTRFRLHPHYVSNPSTAAF